MKRLLLSALLLVASVHAMEEPVYVSTAMEEGRRQAEFINAIDRGDKAKIDELLKSGFNINKPFGLSGPAFGYTPLMLIALGKSGYGEVFPHGLPANREEIARFLISRGANTAPLTPYLERAAENGDVEQVKLLLSIGAKDAEGKALKEATDKYNEYSTDSRHFADEISQFGQVVKLLEQAKRGGPVKLTPTAKPAPAAAKPVAKPAAQPVRLVPTAKPAPAKGSLAPSSVKESLSQSTSKVFPGLGTGKGQTTFERTFNVEVIQQPK